MYLRHVSGSLVEVLEPAVLSDPCRSIVLGRLHAGEEMQEPTEFAKRELAFPSGEALPRCWVDPLYRTATR